ncbi:MAG: hypothetical protein ACK55S_00120, partial [Planctomycetota bacterium]
PGASPRLAFPSSSAGSSRQPPVQNPSFTPNRACSRSVIAPPMQGGMVAQRRVPDEKNELAEV